MCRRISLLKCVWQPEIARNSLKTPIDVSTSGKLVSSACYDTQQVCSICNRSLARSIDSSRNRTFWRVYPNVMHALVRVRLLELQGPNLHR